MNLAVKLEIFIIKNYNIANLGMLGFEEILIRDTAIKLLNILYDEVDWQLVIF